MADGTDAPIATLLRTEGAPDGLPASVPFGAQHTVVNMGRLESNQVALNDRKISKVHCRLIVRTCKRKGSADGEIMTRIFIKDQSTFGTFVNGKALAKEQWTMLQEGDVIGLRNPHGNASLGEYRVQYSDVSAPPVATDASAAAAAEAREAAPAPGLMAVKQEAGAAPQAPQAAAAPPAASPGVAAVKQELAAAAPQRAAPARPVVPQPVRPPLMAVKEEISSSAPAVPQQAAQLPKPPAELAAAAEAQQRPTDPRVPQLQQMKTEPGQDRPRALLPQPVKTEGRQPLPLPTPRPAAPEAAAPAPQQATFSPCSPLEEEEDAAGQPGEENAEPLSPLSEVSEVSADDGTVPQPALPLGLGLPGLPVGLPGMPPPPVGLPGMPPGIPGLPPLPGLPPGLNPAQLLAAMRPGLPPLLDASGRPILPPNALAMLPGLGLALPGLGIPRPPPPAVKVEPGTTVAIPGTAPAGGTSPAAGKPAEAAKPVVMHIQQELVGMLIGRAGETVRQLSKDSGARIEISKTANPDGTEKSGERTVYLSGSQECIDKAKQMIEECLNKSRERVGKTDNPNACTLKIPLELVGMIIGRGGETIKELKKESGARVDVQKEAAEANCNDRLVHISGPPECVEFAKKMVEDMLSRARERIGSDRDREGSRSPRRDRSPGTALSNTARQDTMKVNHELIGMLIGKGGETIKQISKDSGARIEINKDPAAEQEEQRTVYLSGPPSAIALAKEMIEDTLSRSRENRDDRRRRSSRSRSRSRRRSRSRGRGGGRVVHVPQELIGMLIGKGGETVRNISQITGVRIEISKDERETDRAVTLSGSPESVDKAVDAIEDVLKRAKEFSGGGRADRRSSAALALRDEHDYNDGSDRRGTSPIRDSWLNEKVYVDEVEMPRRPNFLPEHEDGLPSDLEIFVKGLPKVCAERDLWEHLYRLGSTDVKEILLLRRQKQSKGMAYVVFNRHDHALMAKHKLNNSPASAIPCGGQMPAEEKGLIQVRFSESERCINGRNNVYNTDMVGLLLGSRGKCMQTVKEDSGLRKVLLTGRNMKSYGQVDEDPRLHMVVYYEPDEVENVTKAIEIWGDQLGKIHLEIMDKCDPKGKGKGKFMHPMMYPPPMMDFPRPPFMEAMPPRPPGPGGDVPPPVEAPVFLQRRKLAPAAEGEAPTLTGPKVLEATALRGRELRWQPWPEVGQFNEDWAAMPMRWGLRGELFVLLRKRESGETRVCAAEVNLPLEKWPVLNSSHTGPRTAKYKSFIFNEHLFLISIDRDSGSLKVFHVPDPSAAWDVAFETTLPEEADLSPEGFGMSRRAKLFVFYAQDRSPHVAVVEPGGSIGAQLFKIVDPAKPWTRRTEEPALSSKARLLPVYTKNKAAPAGEYEVSIFAVDGETNQLNIFRVPADTEKPWILVAKLPFAGDTRLCCVYVPGKPEPLLMAGSPTERLQKLCHLNLIEWTASKLDDRIPPPKAPIVEEKFSRQMNSLWPETGRDTGDAQSVVATPIDCTADLPVSKHAWVTQPLLHGADPPPGAPPGAPMAPPGAPPPPFGRSPFEDPMGPFGGRPPFDPHYPPPPFGMRPPPFGRPPFDDPFGRPPFDVGMGKGGPPGFDPHRPPFDAPRPGGPPPGFERPPFEAGPPPPGFDRRPPFDMPPPGMPPPGMPPGRPPFDAPPGARPPFDAPPGEWFGGGRPPFDAPPRPDGPPPPGALEVGSFVEADFQEKGHYKRAKVIAKHDDGTFDIEYDGDYVEWKVPHSRIRSLPPFPGVPPGMPPPGAPPGAPPGEAPKEKRRHRHRRGEGEDGEGGERRHHRHRRRGAEDAKEGDATAPAGAGSDAAKDEADAGGAPAPEGGDAAEPQRHRKKRRRHHGEGGEEKEAGKDRSASQEPEAGQKKEKKRRHRSGERGRRRKADGAAADDAGGGAPEDGQRDGSAD